MKNQPECYLILSLAIGFIIVGLVKPDVVALVVGATLFSLYLAARE
jgi:hypothetical protein